MAEVSGSVIIRIMGDISHFNDSLMSAGKSIKSFGGQIKSAGMGLTAALTVPILGAGYAALQSADTIQEAYLKIRGNTGATGNDLKGLTNIFDNLYGSLPNKSLEVADAVSTVQVRLGSLGVNVQEVSKYILDLSRMTGESEDKMATGITSMISQWKDYGFNIKDVGGSLDYLWNAFQKTHVPVTTLTKDIDTAGTALRSLGFGWKESIALMATFEQAGLSINDLIRGLEYGWSGLQQAMGAEGPKTSKKGVTGQPSEMYTAASNVRKEIQTLGLDANKAEDQMTALFYGIQNGTVTSEDAVTIFGKRFADQFTGAIREGRLNVNDWIAMVDKMPDSLKKAGSETLTFAQNMTILQHDLDLALAPIGFLIQKAVLAMMPIIQMAMGFIQKLGNVFAELPAPVAAAMVIFAGFLAALGPVIVVVGMLIQSIGSIIIAFSAVIGVVTTVAGAIATFVGGIVGAASLTAALTALAPIVLAVVAVLAALALIVAPIVFAFAALAAGLYLANSLSVTFRETVGILGAAFGDLGGHISAALGDIMSGNFSGAVEELRKGFQEFADTLGNINWAETGRFIVREVQLGIRELKAKWGPIWDDIKVSLEEWLTSVNWQDLGNQLGTGLATMISVGLQAFTMLGEEGAPAGTEQKGEKQVEVMPGVFQNTRGGAAYDQGGQPTGLYAAGLAAAKAFGGGIRDSLDKYINGKEGGIDGHTLAGDVDAAWAGVGKPFAEKALHISLKIVADITEIVLGQIPGFGPLGKMIADLIRVAIGEGGSVEYPGKGVQDQAPGQDIPSSSQQVPDAIKVPEKQFKITDLFAQHGGIVGPQPGGVPAMVSGQRVIVGEAGEPEAIIPKKYWDGIDPAVLAKLPRFGGGGLLYAQDGGFLGAAAKGVEAASGLANDLGILSLHFSVVVDLKLGNVPDALKQIFSIPPKDKGTYNSVDVDVKWGKTSDPVMGQIFGVGGEKGNVAPFTKDVEVHAVLIDKAKQIFGEDSSPFNKDVNVKAVLVDKAIQIFGENDAPFNKDVNVTAVLVDKAKQIFGEIGAAFEKDVNIHAILIDKAKQIFGEIQAAFEKNVNITAVLSGKSADVFGDGAFNKTINLKDGTMDAGVTKAFSGAIDVTVNFKVGTTASNPGGGTATQYGAIVPATAGGMLALVGEGGEKEAIVPEHLWGQPWGVVLSKLPQLAGGALVGGNTGSYTQAIPDWVLQSLPNIGEGVTPRGISVPSSTYEPAKPQWERDQEGPAVNYNAYITVDSENIKREVFEAFRGLENYHHVMG